MHDLNDVQFFVAVVEQSGFSAAARMLNLPKSSVSRHVERLECRLGVRLLERSTRSVRLTEAGGAYYARCRAILAELEEADRQVQVHRDQPAGIIRVSCPTAIAHYAFARIVPGFMARYPLVRLQALATNRVMDLIEDRVDVAIRARARLHDEALMMRKLGVSRLIFVASPDFAATLPALRTPADLTQVPFLSFLEDAERPNWTMIGPGGETQSFSFDPTLWTSDFSIIIAAACAGRGLALLPAEVVTPPIEEGRLVRLLPDWRSEDATVHLVFTTKRGLTPAVQAFIDYLVEHFTVGDWQTT